MMDVETDPETEAVFGAMREALLKETGRIRVVNVIFGPEPYALQVMDGRRKVGPILFPGDGKDLADLMAALGKVILG